MNSHNGCAYWYARLFTDLQVVVSYFRVGTLVPVQFLKTIFIFDTIPGSEYRHRPRHMGTGQPEGQYPWFAEPREANARFFELRLNHFEYLTDARVMDPATPGVQEFRPVDLHPTHHDLLQWFFRPILPSESSTCPFPPRR